MKQYIPIVFALAMIIGSEACSHKKTTAESDKDIPNINVARAQNDSVVIYNTYPGTLQANNTVKIVARVNGVLKSQNYQNGQLVQKGQLLFTIEDTEYRDQVQQAEAALATAKSNRDYAAAQYSAMKKALESDAVSLMEVNKAKSSLEQAEASIRSSQAQLQTARTNLSYCRIYAPYTGHVNISALSVGAYVNGEAAPVELATLYEDASLYAQFFVDDKAIQEILLGNATSPVNLDSIPLRFSQDIPQTYYARLSYISPEVDPSTGTLKIRATVDNRAGDLHDGMYVTISLPSKSDPKAILVKDASISTDQLGKYLYTVGDSSQIVYSPITVGALVNDSMRIVTAGIKPGVPYVTQATLKVREGMKIKPIYEK